MNDKLDLLSIGDASMDVFVTPVETETLCRLDTKESLICFSYGDKIPVKELNFSIGGNAANNAVGTRRLGVNSAALLTLGTDEIGDQIFTKLADEGVDTSFVSRQEGASNYSSAITYGGERTIFTYKVPKKYVFPASMPNVPWVYLTSMAENFADFYEELITWLDQNKEVKLAYNPGSRQLRAGVNALMPILKHSYIVYINRKEAEMITGFASSQGKEKELLKKVSDLGPKIPIITDGSGGSFVYNGTDFLKAGVLPVDAYERTGAGDAFGSGCIAALIQGKDFNEALIWGTINSASVIGYVGSQKGLLTKEALPEWLERAKSCNLKVEKF